MRCESFAGLQPRVACWLPSRTMSGGDAWIRRSGGECMHLHTYRRAALLALPRGISTARTAGSRLRQYRSKFLLGRPAIIAFLTRKWARELDHRLIKKLWAFGDRRIAVGFAYEWHDDSGFRVAAVPRIGTPVPLLSEVDKCRRDARGRCRDHLRRFEVDPI